MDDALFNGSKPIIVTTGARVAMRIVTVKEVSVELTIGQDFSSVSETDLGLQLASVYGVPVSSIALSLRPGSVIVQVQIAPLNGVDPNELAATLAAVDGATLSAALQSSVVVSAAPSVTMRNQSIMEQLDCPAGHWCTAGLVVVCEIGYYSPSINADNQSACRLCPSHSITVTEASTAMSDCLCEANYYNDATDGSVSCAACMLGTACNTTGTQLVALPLLRGWWRAHRHSRDVRQCPGGGDGASGCVGGSGAMCKPSALLDDS